MLSTLLSVLVVVALLAAVVFLVLKALAKRAREKMEQALRSRMGGPDPLKDTAATHATLKPGDVVQYDGRDWVVRGTIALDEEGLTWQEHLLDASGIDGELRRWLSVEEGESGLELVLWQRIPGLALEPTPQVTLGDRTFRQDESGKASFIATGTTGTGPSGTLQYADYLSDGSTRLSFERWTRDGSWEISTGEPVTTEQLRLLHR